MTRDRNRLRDEFFVDPSSTSSFSVCSESRDGVGFRRGVSSLAARALSSNKNGVDADVAKVFLC